MKGELNSGEPHPAAASALRYIASLGLETLCRLSGSFASCAIGGNRDADICGETLRRIMASEPVSDRYVLGLAWYVRHVLNAQPHDNPALTEQVKNLEIDVVNWKHFNEQAEQIAALRQQLADYNDALAFVKCDKCSSSEQHCGCVAVLRADNKRLERELAERFEWNKAAIESAGIASAEIAALTARAEKAEGLLRRVRSWASGTDNQSRGLFAAIRAHLAAHETPNMIDKGGSGQSVSDKEEVQ